MRNSGHERELLREFAEFVEAVPAAPGSSLDAEILQRVAADLRPPRWIIFTRLGLAQAAGGLLTLSVCPQFGLGAGTHQALLHDLHSALPPAAFYFVCGLFFVGLGTIFGGLLLKRAELRVLGRTPWSFFLGFGALAYTLLMILGSEAFMAASLAWIAGAVVGNFLGFAVMAWLRQRPA